MEKEEKMPLGTRTCIQVVIQTKKSKNMEKVVYNLQKLDGKIYKT